MLTKLRIVLALLLCSPCAALWGGRIGQGTHASTRFEVSVLERIVCPGEEVEVSFVLRKRLALPDPNTGKREFRWVRAGGVEVSVEILTLDGNGDETTTTTNKIRTNPKNGSATITLEPGPVAGGSMDVMLLYDADPDDDEDDDEQNAYAIINVYVLAKEDKDELKMKSESDQLQQSLRDLQQAEDSSGLKAAARKTRQQVEKLEGLTRQAKAAALESLEKIADGKEADFESVDLSAVYRIRETLNAEVFSTAPVVVKNLSKSQIQTRSDRLKQALRNAK